MFVNNIEQFYLSNLFYNLDSQNSFSATFFLDLKKVFGSRIYLTNLLNYDDFNTYFRNNFIISSEAYIEKDNNKLLLNFNYENNTVLLASNKQNDLISLRSDNNIDVIKFNNGNLKIKIFYNESSVNYTKNIIIPFLDEASTKIINNTLNNNDIGRLLILYKLIKEINSDTESINNLEEFSRTLDATTLTNENIQDINNLISVTKQKYISKIRDIKTEYISNTILELMFEEKLDLLYTNTRISFSDMIGGGIMPTYSAKQLSDSFTNEINRCFGDTEIIIDNSTIDRDSLPITFSVKEISIGQDKIYDNLINFNDYISSNIENAVLDKAAYDFLKSIIYFSSQRDIESTKVASIELLDNNLFYNNLICLQEEVSSIEDPTKRNFNYTKKDDSRSYKKFPTYMVDNACLDASPETQLPKIVAEKNREIRRNIPENLFNNLSCNYLFEDSNAYLSKYSRISSIENLPIQVLYSYSQFKNRTNFLFQDKEPVIANSKLFSIFYTNFKLIAKVEYLEDLSDGMYSFWRALTPSIINQLNSKKILCRFNFYYNSDVGIKEQTFDQFSIYNRYFYIEA